jgi:hypothetical protein
MHAPGTSVASPLALALLGLDAGDWLRAGLTVVFAVVLVRLGAAVLGSFARPVPEPPDPGELRRVRLTYRCSICATEVRMTMANDEVPEPPRHCQEDMDLVTPVDDL